ncbi:MAG: hypothetical protein RIT81_22335 [Deltaproteobacteria bacterium]
MPRNSFVSLALCSALALVGCKQTEETAQKDPAAPRDAGQPTADAPPEEDDEIRPVYPEKIETIPPIVTRLCKALHERPKVRRAECCERKPGVLLTSECERNLAGALLVKGVVLDEAKVEACEAAIETQHEGCDWVAPTPLKTPEACHEFVTGTRQLGQACRSTLECPDGMHCVGGGPTDLGRCGPPAPPRASCNTGVDPLVTYLRQTHVERTRPVCDGFCDRNRCRAFIEPGGACVSNVQCGPEHRCREGVCAGSALAAEGEPCIGGDCAAGLSCSEKRCVAPKAAGASCSVDSECKSSCIAGKCKMSCDTAPVLRQLSKPMVPREKMKKRKAR